MIIVRPLIDVLGKIMKLPKNSYLDPTTLGSGTPSSSNWLRGDSVWASITPGPTNYGLYTQTASSTPVTNTTIETSLLDGGVGTLTVPANGFNVGDSFHAILTGHLSAVNNHKLHIRIKSGSVVLADTGQITMAGTTSKHWKLEVYFTVRALGTSGVAAIASGGTFMYTKNASNAFEGTNFSSELTTGFSTTISNTLVVTAQWDTASTNDSIYSEIFTLNKTY
jgi:hypothetical protein